MESATWRQRRSVPPRIIGANVGRCLPVVSPGSGRRSFDWVLVGGASIPEVCPLLEVFEQSALEWGPAEVLTGARVRGRAVSADERRERPEVCGRFFRRMRDEWNAELTRDHGGNISDRDSLLGDGVVSGIGPSTLEGQAEGCRRIAHMHRWPALIAISYVGRDSLRTSDRDERRHEVSIAVSVHDSEAKQRDACAMRCSDRRGALGDPWVTRVACDVFFARNARRLEGERSGGDDQEPFRAGDCGAQRLDCTPVHFATFCPVREVELEGRVDHGVRSECAAPKPFEVREIARLNLRT